MANKEELEDRKRRLKILSNDTNQVITVKQQNVEKEKVAIIEIQRYKNYVDYSYDMIDNSIDKANEMPENVFYEVKTATDSILTSGPTVTAIAGESQSNLDLSNQHISTFKATQSYVTSGAANLTYISQNYPQYFPNAPDIVSKYKPEDKLENNIKYIKSKLPNVPPDISKDFDEFEQNFRSGAPAEEKYMLLIACRTMLYYKLIFSYVRTVIGPANNRRDAIVKFATGGKTLNPADEPVIDNMKELWNELSDQNENTPHSVKVGNVTKEYNEQLFRRIIGNLTALFKLREKYIP